MRPLLLLASAASLFAAEPVTFLRDVAPILNKVGCTSGPCHGAAKGKNGFKLSLRGYDPQFDYEALLYDLSGRRFNRAEPGRSLMLAKPTQQVAARRRSAIREGLRLLQDDLSTGSRRACRMAIPRRTTLRRSTSQPKEVVMPKPGEIGAGEGSRPFRRRPDARCHGGSDRREQHSRRRESRRSIEGNGRARRRSDAAGSLSGQVRRRFP